MRTLNLPVGIDELANALLGASLLAWCWIAARAFARRQPPLAWVEREPCPWPGSVAALALPVSLIVQTLVLLLLPAQAPEQAGQLNLSIVRNQSLARLATVGALLALIAAESRLQWADLGLARQRSLRDLRYAALAFLASWAPVLLINRAVSALGWRAAGGIHPLLKLLQAEPGGAALAWVVVSAVLLAPLLEELLYRVILQGWLETRIGPGRAIPLVAALFAAVHFEPGRPDALPLLPLALVLGYLYWRRHSYPAVVAAHALFNAVNICLAMIGS